MKTTKNDNYYLEKMLFYIDFIMQYFENLKRKNLVLRPNDQDSDGIAYKFIQLKEEAKNLSNELLFNNFKLAKHISLLNGFRNRLTHDYENVQYRFFYEIIENDLPDLKREIIKILEENKVFM